MMEYVFAIFIFILIPLLVSRFVWKMEQLFERVEFIAKKMGMK